MSGFPILQTLGYILFTAAIAVLILRRFGVPTIVAYMVAGIVLGPVTGMLTETAPVELIGEVGIALLLFLIGLELSLTKIRGVGVVAVAGGTVQIALTALAGWTVAALLGLRGAEAVLFALAATFSSTVVVVKLLGQKRETGTVHGRIAVGILIVQDVAAVLALTILAGMSDAGDGVLPIVRGVSAAFIGMLALAAGAAAGGRWLLPRVFTPIRRSAETVFICSLAWCFVFILAAETLHLSVELGAFIAGVGLAQLHFTEELRRRVQPIVNFFLAVFFVSLAVRVRPGAALGEWPLVVALTITALTIKPMILLLTLRRLGVAGRNAFLSSITLAQMSEFSFILAALAAAAGLLGDTMLSVIMVAGFLTIGVSSFVIQWSGALYERVRRGRLSRLLGAGSYEGAGPAPAAGGHVIVVGMNTLGRRLIELLQERGQSVIAVDTDPAKLDTAPCPTLLGSVDEPDVLEEAGFRNARLVISALQIEDSNNLLAYRCRRAGVPVAVNAFDVTLIDELRQIGVDHLMMPKHEGTRLMVQLLREAGVLD